MKMFVAACLLCAAPSFVHHQRLVEFAQCHKRAGHLTAYQVTLMTGGNWQHYYALLVGNMPCLAEAAP